MNDQDGEPADDRPPSEQDDVTRHHQVQVPGVTARVPSTLGHGVISTGAIVMNGPHVFVLDFLQQLGVPNHLVRRVVLPHAVVPRFVQALEQNLANYQEKFGPPMKLPRAANPTQRPSIDEVYDNIKVSDDELPGHFAEGVMIRHSAAEFCFDFVTQFYPNAAVSSRVFLSAPHVPPLLEAIKGNYQQFLESQKNSPNGGDPNDSRTQDPDVTGSSELPPPDPTE